MTENTELIAVNYNIMIIQIIIGVIVSIILHELAHLFAAKLVGCKIESISLGFGKTVYSFKYNNIICNLNLLLFGGDCQLKGERIYSDDKDAFCNLPYWKKVIISIAGCLINIILGLIMLVIGFYSFYNFWFYLGGLNILLGIINLIPIPCLDGSYLVFIWLIKLLGQKKGYNLFIKINKIALKFWIIVNLLSIPFAYILLKKSLF